MSAFVSEIRDLSVHDGGWLRVGGIEITKLPIWDVGEALFARLGFGPAGAWLESRGWRLPSRAEYEVLHREALHIEPYTMPTVEMIKAVGISLSDEHGINRYRNNNMRSREWCFLHDTLVLARLASEGWTDEAVANAGKHWGQDSAIYGWWLGAGGMIQGWRVGAHTSTYTDYATTFHAVRDASGTSVEVPPDSTEPPDSTPSFTARRTLRLKSPYMKGDDVRKLQGAIGAIVDGSFGPHTKALTVAFQREHMLVPDGIAGAKTWAAVDALDDPYEDTDPPPVTLSATVIDLSAIPFRRARHLKPGRYVEIAGITIHTAEISERTNSAEALQAYAATKDDDRQASWHYATDCDSITASVKTGDVAFAAGPGNDSDIHIEISGRAGQGAAGWADDYSTRTIENTARLCAALVQKYPQIPVVRNDVQALIDGARGFRGHSDWSLASAEARKRGEKRTPWWSRSRNRWRSTNHMDPGPTFPWDSFLAAVRGFG